MASKERINENLRKVKKQTSPSILYLCYLSLIFTCAILSFHQGTTTTEITDRKFVSVDGLRCKYLVRKVIRTLTKPMVEAPRRAAPTKSKRGRTLRPKIVLQPDDEDDERSAPSGPRVFEAWYPEVRICFTLVILRLCLYC